MPGEESSDESLLILQAQETVENFFKTNKFWSLLEFLNFRAKTDYFTRDKRKEHGLYKKALELLDNAQAREYLSNFEAKYMFVATTYVTTIAQPDAYVPTGCYTKLWLTHLNLCFNEKSSGGVLDFWTMIEKKRYEDNIEKESLGYINDVIDDAVKDSKEARTFLADKLKSFVKGHTGKRNYDHMQDRESHTADPKKSKTDSTFGVSFEEYTTVVHAVESLQEVNESAHTDPLWWGVLDFREENISPSPDLPRAKNFLSTDEIDRLMGMIKSAIQEEKKHISKSVESFLEALLLSDIVSLRLLAKECGARGVAGVCDLLQKSADRMQDVSDRNVINDHIKNIDVDDEATIYVGKCIEDTYTWINCFPGQSQSERTVDMFLIGPCAKTPHTIFTYGENHSDADRDDEIERSGTQRVGKACDFLYWSSSREAGIGENTGPTHKDNHDKAKTNLVDVIKVSRAQHIELENQIIEQNGKNPLPDSLQKGIASIFVPFFQIIGFRIRFYILFQINGHLYGFWDWASEFLPTKDADVGELVLLCKRFLVHGNLVERVGQMISVLAKKSKTFKDKIIDAGESSQTTVELNKLRTPAKKSERSQ
ncbi:2447_t:CDS:10, partial [Ambispora leptoticha]